MVEWIRAWNLWVYQIPAFVSVWTCSSCPVLDSHVSLSKARMHGWLGINNGTRYFGSCFGDRIMINKFTLSYWHHLSHCSLTTMLVKVMHGDNCSTNELTQPQIHCKRQKCFFYLSCTIIRLWHGHYYSFIFTLLHHSILTVKFDTASLHYNLLQE